MVKKTTTSTSNTASKKQKEETLANAAAEAAAAEKAATKTAAKAKAQSESEAEATDVEQEQGQEQTLAGQVAALIETTKEWEQTAKHMRKVLYAISKNVGKLEKSGGKKKSSGEKKPHQYNPVPVLSKEMTEFITKHKDLVNKEGATIITAMEKNGDGKLTADRHQVVSLVNSYIRAHNLGEGTSVKMDATLKKLFPDVPAQEFGYKSIMGGISPHLGKKAPVSK